MQALGVVCAGDAEAERILWNAVYTGQDETPKVRAAAIQALADGWHGDPAMAERLRKAVERSDTASVLNTAFNAVCTGWRNDPLTLPWLQRLAVEGEYSRGLSSDAISRLARDWRDEPGTRKLLLELAASGNSIAASRLGSAWPGDPEVGKLLRTLAQEDQRGVEDGSKPSRQRWVVRALGSGWREDPMTLPLLRAAATSDENSTVRKTALKAIAYGWPEDIGTAALLHHAARNDSDYEVRRMAVSALACGWRDDPAVLPTLQTVAESDESEPVKIAALRAMALCCPTGPDAKRIVREAVGPGHGREVRFHALQIATGLWHADQETLPWLLMVADEELSETVDEEKFNALRLAIFLALTRWWPYEERILPLLRTWATRSWWLVRDIADLAIRINASTH